MGSRRVKVRVQVSDDDGNQVKEFEQFWAEDVPLKQVVETIADLVERTEL